MRLCACDVPFLCHESMFAYSNPSPFLPHTVCALPHTYQMRRGGRRQQNPQSDAATQAESRHTFLRHKTAAATPVRVV